VHANVKPEEGRKPPVCTNCHLAHGTVRLDGSPNRLKTPEECHECHQAAYQTYRSSFHGKATQLGLDAAATCSDCHTPHRMLSKDNPKSSVHPANLRATCEKCHGEVTASFLQFKPHVNPADPKESPLIHYIWLFMTTLLLAVLAFFAVHTVLWTQRAVVAYLRGELKPHHEGEVWVRRFRPIHIWIHLTIIVTFLTLAFTGLPIKFSGEGWAQPLANAVGGPGAARWLHRAAGVVTFGYGFVFLGYLLREIVVRKRRSLLWGWQSMVPGKKDLKDLFDNLKWFLYLGQRPKLDRWAYWEKFDFFAVFWGIPVIGLSGLVLWFPVAASNVLPGWALNIAYIIHSDEALLATGFIFFFHFFHTHLRPEAFPLDPVIFTGSMPLERFIDERPAEHARLVASGELEQYLVGPPSEQRRTFAIGFGFFALAVGLLLGFSLMATGVHMVLHYLGLE
jgi:cytochrome b subunit of formate dehydrogenase